MVNSMEKCNVCGDVVVRNGNHFTARSGQIRIIPISGNLDGRLIKDKAKEYGFQLADHDKAASRDGVRLLNVKTKRNELAHGGISFEDCGQDTSVDELVAIFDEIKIFIKAVLDGVSDYLSTRSYLHAVNANTVTA